MTNLIRRLLRIFGQHRIRLPRRPVEPHDIRPGDRLQIGHEVWRVCRTWPPSGLLAGSFALTAEEASAPVARLFTPDGSSRTHDSSWLLIKGGDRFDVPPEMIVAFPAGHPTGRRNP